MFVCFFYHFLCHAIWLMSFCLSPKCMSLDCGGSWSTIYFWYIQYMLWLFKSSTLYILKIWAIGWTLSCKVVFIHFFFSPFHLGTLCVLCPPPSFFSIFGFIHSHTLKDCEESVPAEEPRKSMDHSMCDFACDLLCTVVFLLMLQLYLVIYFSTFCNWIPCKKAKLMRTKSLSHYIHSNYSIPQLTIMLLGCTFCFLNLVS